jgi:triphosphoribosyl-dephospho-CoA synthase
MVQTTSAMKPSQNRDAFARPEQLARLAWQSLVAEAELTPKPGLVDRRSSGSHSDLSLELMRKSADAIAPYLRPQKYRRTRDSV